MIPYTFQQMRNIKKRNYLFTINFETEILVFLILSWVFFGCFPVELFVGRTIWTSLITNRCDNLEYIYKCWPFPVFNTKQLLSSNKNVNNELKWLRFNSNDWDLTPIYGSVTFWKIYFLTSALIIDIHSLSTSQNYKKTYFRNWF